MLLNHYHVLAASATSSGHCGVQPWVARNLTTDQGDLQVRPANLRVLHQSPRRRLVRFSVDGLRILFIVGHVPVAPDESAARSWWAETARLIPSSLANWPCVLLVDANSRIGSMTSSAIGDHQPSEENTYEEIMHQWLIDNAMFAPQTMHQHHSGSATTFTHSRGNEGRIDFILLREDLRHDDLHTFVMDVDLALHRPDHLAVAVDLPILWLRQCHLDLAWHLGQYRRLCVQVSCQVRADDAQYFAAFAQRHSDEAFTLWKSLQPLLPKQIAKRKNNLRCIGPATRDIAVHFDGLEAGALTSHSTLLDELPPGAATTFGRSSFIGEVGGSAFTP